MIDYIQQGIDKKLISFNENRSRITYLHQGKERNYNNPEEKVQCLTFLKLILEYGYPVKHIKQFVPVTMGSEVKEADIIVYGDDMCFKPYILIECKRQEVSEEEFLQAIEQAYSYAFALSGEIKYVWVTSEFRADALNCAALANNYLKTKENLDGWMVNVIANLKQGELEPFHEQLTSFLASIPYNMRRKDNEREKERYFHYTFYLLLRMLSTYLVYTEKVQSQGRVDCIVETSKFIYIFEFKLDGSADEALQQIEDKGYAHEYAADERKIYKIGCSFSSDTGTINDWKVL